MVHLVYCNDKEKELGRIASGAQTMVVRGAAGRKFPHSRVFVGETLFFMEKGSGKITGKAAVTDVQNYVKLTDEEIDAVLEKNDDRLRLSDAQKIRWHKKCLCLAGFSGFEPIEPLAFDRQKNMDDWLILEKIEDAVVGTAKPFTYVKI